MKLSNKYFINYQSGGTNDKNFYIPCDITHYTNKKYYSQQSNCLMVKSKIGNSDENVFPLKYSPFLNAKQYRQDFYIQLYNGSCYINLFNEFFFDKKQLESEYMLHEFSRDYNILLLKSELTSSEQSKGGNFIGAPNGSIICVNNIEPKILEYLNKFTSKPLIELKCSFKAGGEVNSSSIRHLHSQLFRHVDELLCFMPYGKNKFKIWFYDEFNWSNIQNNKKSFNYLYNIYRLSNNLEIKRLTEELTKQNNEIISCCQILKPIETKVRSIIKSLPLSQEISKCSSEIDSLESKKETILCQISKNIKQQDDLELELKQINETIETIDKHMVKLNCERNRIQKNIYDSDPEYMILANKKKDLFQKMGEIELKLRVIINHPVTDQDLIDYIKLLNQERLDNLELLSQFIFNGPYSSNTDKFVFFNYNPAGKSIFNRLWYETVEKAVCLFPHIDDKETIDRVNQEMNLVKSYISGSCCSHHFILDLPKPKLENPEGTLHCLIKQRFVKP